jgi:CubicO group peptidase (beta-lactamase class C family)
MLITFGIASNSKAFTSASLAILVDEGKIKWDDKVINTFLILKCTMST